MKQNTTYKQTELGLIPDDWEVKKLGEVIKLGNGKDYKHLNSGNIPVYGTGGIITYVDKYLFNGKSVGIGRKGSIDKPVLLDGKFWTVDTLFYVKEFFNSDIDFIYNSFLKIPWLKYNEATGLPSLSQNIINNLKIPLPPLPEQKKIADFLSTWDCAIEKQSALINALTERKKALMQQLLTGKKRLPGFSEEWKEVKMGDLFEKINRKNEEGNTNVVTISAQRGFVKQTDFFNKSVASETLDNYSLIYHGEFCYNKSYSNGYPLGATKRLIAFEKAVVTTLYICFKIKDQKKSNGSFFEQFFEANSLDRSLIKIAQEGGRAHGLLNVSLSDFFNIKIKLPPIEEQTAIAEILAAADRELQLQKEKLAQLQAQKKGLMQVLLTGKKRLIN